LYNGTKVYDVHGHVSAGPQNGQYMNSLLTSNSHNQSPLLTGKPNPAEQSYRDAAARHIAYMDERNIDVQLIGPRPFAMLAHYLPMPMLRLWTEHVNAAIAQQVGFYPGRFIGACQLPQDDQAPDSTHMLETLEHCVKDYGFGATYVSPDPQGRRTTPGLNEPYWYPLYERCIELDVPIIIHGTNTVDPRFHVVRQNYQMGFLIEQFIAWQILANTDVFVRYPALRVVVCHCGGALNRFMTGDEHHSPQSDFSANLFYDTCAHEINFLTTAIRQKGVSQMAFGTEAPGSGYATRKEGEGPGISGDDLVPVIASFDWLTEQEKVQILNGNPLKVAKAFGKV
jgi:predicted TIM-barrel fold metal-dependent hydrolase